jgi:ATP-binding protein involved in chromosome partitioning
MASSSDARGFCYQTVFEEITRNVVQEVVSRNENLPATEAVKITTMAGCSAVKKNKLESLK